MLDKLSYFEVYDMVVNGDITEIDFLDWVAGIIKDTQAGTLKRTVERQ